MNKRVFSMVLSIILVAMTLLSLGISYLSYQSEIEERDQQIVEEEELAELEREELEKQAEADYQKRLAEYEEAKKKAEENGQVYRGAYPWKAATFTPNDFFIGEDAVIKNIKKYFQTKIIIHFIVIGFILLAEIGLLLVLPKKPKDINVNINHN
jgi:hypothetical protein